MVIYDILNISGTDFTQSRQTRIDSTMSAANSASSFTFVTDNFFGNNKDSANIGNEVIIYAEKDVNPPTRKIFGGFVDSVDFNETPAKGIITVRGRDYWSIAQDATIPPIRYINLDCGSIVKDLFDRNTSGLFTGSIPVNTGQIINYKRYNHLHVSDAVKELAEEIGYYAYVDVNRWVRFEPQNSVSASFTAGSQNVTNATIGYSDNDLANEVYVYGDRVLTAVPNITKISDGVGSVIQLDFKPFNTEVANSGTNIVKGGVFNENTTPQSGTFYLVDFENAKIIWTSGTGIGNNVPGSLTVSTVKYDRMNPIVKYVNNEASIAAYGKKSRVIINKAIKDPLQATSTALTTIMNDSSPTMQGTLEMDGVDYAVPGNQVLVNLPNDNIVNTNYQIVTASYNFTPTTRLNDQVMTLKVNKRLLDVTDTIKQILIDLRKIQAGDIDDSDILTRINTATVSGGFFVDDWKVYQNNINDSFIVGHPYNGALGIVNTNTTPGSITGSLVWASGVGIGYNRAIVNPGSWNSSEVVIPNPNDYVYSLTTTTSNQSGNATGMLSLSYWANIPNTGSHSSTRHLLGKSSSTSGHEWAHRMTNGGDGNSNHTFYFFGSPDAGQSTAATFGVTSNDEWHHYLAVGSKSNPSGLTMWAYLDGSLIGSTYRASYPEPLGPNRIEPVRLFRRGADSVSEPATIDDFRIYNRVISGTEIGSLFSKVNYPVDRLVGYYKLDEGTGSFVYNSASVEMPSTIMSGTTVITDPNLAALWRFNESGTSFNSVITGYSGLGYSGVSMVDGVYGNGSAVAFNGGSSFIATNMLGVGSSPFTVATWVNLFTDSNSAFMSNYSSGYGQGFALAYRNSIKALSWEIRSGTDTSTYISGGSPFPLNKWTHIAGVFDGTNRYAYINGSIVTSGAYSTPPISANVTIFGVLSGGTKTWYTSGAMDETRIYNRALSSGEIYTLYAGKTIQPLLGDRKTTTLMYSGGEI